MSIQSMLEIMQKENILHCEKKKKTIKQKESTMKTFLNKKVDENTTLKFIQDYIREFDINTIAQLVRHLGVSESTIRKMLSDGEILYRTKHKIFKNIKTDYFIQDEDGFILNFKNAPEELKKQLKEQRYQEWREESFIYEDYRYHHVPGDYFKALAFWSKMMREHNYNYYNVALDRASEYYKVDKEKLKEYITERCQDGKNFYKELREDI